MKKRFLSFIVSFNLILSIISFVPITSYATYTPTADAYTVINYALSKVGNYYQADRCEAFVADCLEYSIGVGGRKVCAHDAWNAYGISSDANEIPLGAAVYWSGGNYWCGDGHYAGHAAIYVGDGYIVHAYHGSVHKELLSYVNSYWSNYTYLGWGWQGGYALATTEPVDVGTDFYTYIFNQPSWKTVAWDSNSSNVFLESEKWTANQRWFATRNDDGSYTFKNAANNKCLDVANSGTVNLTNVQVVDSSGGDAQKWFIYAEGGNYVLSPKCSPGMVLDLYNGDTSEHSNVCIYNKNGENGQLYTLYKVEAEAGTPNIKSNAQYIYTDGTAIISWDATEYTNHYKYYLTEYPEGDAYNTYTRTGDVYGTSVAFSNLTSGGYTCFVHAVSEQDKWGPQSNWVSFKVYEKDYVPKKTVVYKEHIYALYDYEMAWDFAKNLCTDLGGHLVTITNAEENQVITDLIQFGTKDAYWIGATDINNIDKNYKWVTGEAFSFSNWANSEPSSTGVGRTKEHFAEIRKSYSNKWNDVYNINKSNKGFILEIEIKNYEPINTELFNGNQYLLFDKNTTWSEAEVFCEQLGGHLVTIDSTEEKEFIQNLLKSGKRYWYYLGGQYKGGKWTWYDGRTAEYIPFAYTSSSVNGKKLMMYRSNGKCIDIDNAYSPETDIKNIGFVCEIENVGSYFVLSETINGTTYNCKMLFDITFAEQTACAIIAFYDEEQKLIQLQSKDITIESGNLDINIDIENEEYSTYKLMIWDSFSSMQPLISIK